MTIWKREVYEFAEFQFDSHRPRLYRNGEPILLPPKSLAVLCALLQKPGQLVERDELLRTVWGESFIEDANLTVAISTLRKTLRHNGDQPMIETISRLGYRFTAVVRQSGKLHQHPRISIPALSRNVVGREKELTSLRHGLDSARNGRGSMLCITGEPGIGKTTVVEDFLTSLTPADAQISRGRCAERLAGTEAYLPILEVLAALLNSYHETARLMEEVAPIWYAQIAPVATSKNSLTVDYKIVSQERLKRELLAFFQALTQAQPLVLFFDDLHWADVSTVDVLAYLAANFMELPILIVVTYRPTELLLAKHPFVLLKPDLQSRGICQELHLEFLTSQEMESYLALEFTGHQFSAEFLKLIYSKTEGNPLFMVDLLHYLRDRSAITDSSGAWELVQPLPEIEHELPESVRGMIERKIAQLSEKDHELLLVASVQGYEFDSAVIAQVLKIDADEIEHRLEEIEHVIELVRLVSEETFPNGTLTSRFRFVHVLYQNELYAKLRITRRTALSGAVAQALLEFHGEQIFRHAAKLANLFEVAHDYSRAAEYFAIGARATAQINAHREAAEMLQRSLSALRELPLSPLRDQHEIGLQLALGLSLQSVQGWTSVEVNEAFGRAYSLSQQFRNDSNLLAALIGIGLYRAIRAEYELARELSTQFLPLAQQANEPLLFTVAHFGLGAINLYQGELIEARQQFELALTYYQPSRHQEYLAFINEDVGVMTYRCLSQCLWLSGYVDQALERANEALKLAGQLNHPFSLGGAHQSVHLIHFFRREWKQCQDHCEEEIKLAQDYEQGSNLRFAWIYQAIALVYQQPVESAIDQIRLKIDSVMEIGEMHTRSMLLTTLSELYEMSGQAGKGIDSINEALQFTTHTGEHFYEPEIWRVKGLLLLQDKAINSEAEAESSYQKAIAISQQQNAKSLELRAATSLARLWQRQGKTAEALDMLGEIYNWFTEGFATADLQDAQTLLKELH